MKRQKPGYKATHPLHPSKFCRVHVIQATVMHSLLKIMHLTACHGAAIEVFPPPAVSCDSVIDQTIEAATSRLFSSTTAPLPHPHYPPR